MLVLQMETLYKNMKSSTNSHSFFKWVINMKGLEREENYNFEGDIIGTDEAN